MDFLKSRDGWIFLITSFFTISGFPSLWDIVSEGIKRNDFVGAFSVILFLCVIAFLLIKYRPRFDENKLPELNCFFPFDGGNTKLHLWSRKKELQEIISYLNESNKKIVVVIGPSGTGKTVLMKRQLMPELKSRSLPIAYINSYFGAEDIPCSSDLKKSSVVILDQFEQLFSQGFVLEDIDKINEMKNLIYKKVECLIESGYKVIVVVREDKYYLLKFLKEYLPLLYKSIEISVISSDTHPEIYKDFKNILSNYFDKKIDLNLNNNTMLELQAYGALIEINKTIGERIKGLLNMAPLSAVKKLIDLYVEYSPDKVISSRVLCALNSAVYKSGLSLAQLSYAIDAKSQKVLDACEYLLSKGVLRKIHEYGNYKISHDALEIPISMSTAEKLNAVDRDNIVNSVKSLRSNALDCDEILSRKKIFYNFSAYVLMIIFVLIGFRLFYPSEIWYLNTTIKASEVSGKSMMDVFYFPIAINHFLWCYYILLHDIKVFREKDFSFWQRVLSIIMSSNLIFCVIVGMLYPDLWVIAIGWGGVIYAIKNLSLAKSGVLSDIARDVFLKRGLRTMANMIITIFFGLVVWYVYNSEIIGASENIVFLTYVLAFLLLWEWIIMFDMHISEKQAISLRAILKMRNVLSAQ